MTQQLYSDGTPVRYVQDVHTEPISGDKRRIAELEAELTWYGEQARLCRLIHSEGDAGRNALAADGGKRARAALTKSET